MACGGATVAVPILCIQHLPPIHTLSHSVSLSRCSHPPSALLPQMNGLLSAMDSAAHANAAAAGAGIAGFPNLPVADAAQPGPEGEAAAPGCRKCKTCNLVRCRIGLPCTWLWCDCTGAMMAFQWQVCCAMRGKRDAGGWPVPAAGLLKILAAWGYRWRHFRHVTPRCFTFNVVPHQKVLYPTFQDLKRSVHLPRPRRKSRCQSSSPQQRPWKAGRPGTVHSAAAATRPASGAASSTSPVSRQRSARSATRLRRRASSTPIHTRAPGCAATAGACCTAEQLQLLDGLTLLLCCNEAASEFCAQR